MPVRSNEGFRGCGSHVCLSEVMKDFGGCLCVSVLDGPSEGFRGCGE